MLNRHATLMLNFSLRTKEVDQSDAVDIRSDNDSLRSHNRNQRCGLQSQFIKLIVMRISVLSPLSMLLKLSSLDCGLRHWHRGRQRYK